MSSSSDNAGDVALGSPKTAEKAEKEVSTPANNSPQPHTSSGSERKSPASGTQSNSTTTPGDHQNQSFSSPEVQKTVKGRSANAPSVTKGVGVRPYLAVLSLFLASHLINKHLLKGVENVKQVEFPGCINADPSKCSFASFQEFYPFYISQHQDQTCRMLHAIGTTIVLFLSYMEINVIISLFLGAVVGLSINNVTIMMSNGILEFFLMGATYVYFMKKTTGNYKLAAMVPIVAYFFAWLGHFKFEGNRPATFMYPSFSLIGDFRLYYEYVTSLVMTNNK